MTFAAFSDIDRFGHKRRRKRFPLSDHFTKRLAHILGDRFIGREFFQDRQNLGRLGAHAVNLGLRRADAADPRRRDTALFLHHAHAIDH